MNIRVVMSDKEESDNALIDITLEYLMKKKILSSIQIQKKSNPRDIII